MTALDPQVDEFIELVSVDVENRRPTLEITEVVRYRVPVITLLGNRVGPRLPEGVAAAPQNTGAGETDTVCRLGERAARAAFSRRLDAVATLIAAISQTARSVRANAGAAVRKPRIVRGGVRRATVDNTTVDIDAEVGFRHRGVYSPRVAPAFDYRRALLSAATSSGEEDAAGYRPLRRPKHRSVEPGPVAVVDDELHIFDPIEHDARLVPNADPVVPGNGTPLHLTTHVTG